jgi:hypothetical protein
VDLREEGVNFIHLDKTRVQRRAVLNTVKISVP